MFEKEAEEWVKENMDCCRTESCTGKDIPYFDEEERCCAKSAFKDGAELGYEQGIGRLRYCCTCKKWKECKVESMYGICADWEIKGE